MLNCFSHIQLFATPWTAAHQTPLSMGLSRQEYWSGLPCPPPGDLPDSGIKPMCLASPALAGGFFTTSTTQEALYCSSVQFSSVAQSCTTLCNPMDCSPSGSSVHGIVQARILEWVAISSSRESSQPMNQTHTSYVSFIGRQVFFVLFCFVLF